MGLKIERGIRQEPVAAVLYGTEGIGKSTLAADFPKPLILDTEHGSGRINCARVRCDDWMALYGALIDLGGDPQGFQTIVIDSIDWAESMLRDHMLKKDGKKSLEDYGFGKGHVKLAEQFATLLSVLDQLVRGGLHVLLVGHSTVKRTSPPDMEEGYDRYELKLTRQVAPLVKEWADVILFANYRTKLVEGADGRVRGRGGKERILYTERAAAWDAKNRFGLPPELPMAIDGLAPLFAAGAAAAGQAAFDQAAEYIATAKSVKALGKAGDRIDELASDGSLDTDQVAELMGMINRRHEELEPVEVGQ